MKTIYLLLIGLFTIQTAFAQTQKIDDKKLEKIASYFQTIEDNNRDIGAVSLFQNGKEIYNYSFGQKNLTDKTINTEQLSYQIGSISKTITAIVLYQMEEEKKIDLNEKLSSYYPQIKNSEKITLNQMLNHRSGISDFVAKQDSITDWLFKPVSDSEIIEVIQDYGPQFEPGSKQEYSNGGYFLLAKIIEDKLEQPYKKIVMERIFKPLGLEKTHSIEKNDHYPIAKSYQKGEKWEVMNEFYFPNITGVGDIISTPSELNKIMEALFSEKLISEESLQKMIPAHEEIFGYGLMLVPFYNHIMYGHGGDTKGTHSVVAYSKEDNLGIAYVVNGEDLPTNDLAIGFLNIIYDKEQSVDISAKESYNVNPEDLKQYEGIYGAEDFPLKLTVTQVDNKLQCQGTGQPAFIVKAISKDTFEFEKAKLKLEFIPTEDKLIVFQGQRFELTRKK